MEKKATLVLFGAGEKGREYLEELESWGVEILCYADNDRKKWGITWNGKPVIPPEELRKMKGIRILVSCVNSYEIIRQLLDMRLGDRMTSMEQIKCEIMSEQISFKIPESGRHWSYLVENVTGTWGGAEDWAHAVGLGLKENDKPVYILEDVIQQSQGERLESIIVRFSLMNRNYWKENDCIMEFLYDKLPFVLINNSCNEVLTAVAILKIKFPRLVKIISIIHNDNDRLYEKHWAWEGMIDKYICVSNTIKNKFSQKYLIQQNKLYAALNFSVDDYPIVAEHSLDREIPIKIGYAGRLIIEHKRVDCISMLVQKLKEKNIRFHMHIAGDGPDKDKLLNALRDDIQKGTIIYLGKLEKREMTNFWAKQDIMISFSEYEGCSLCLIEAMKCGIVPVATRVSGADELVKKQNGILFEVGDVDGCAEAIERLEKDRKLLNVYGITCQEIYREKCTMRGYMKFLEKIIEELLAGAGYEMDQ